MKTGQREKCPLARTGWSGEVKPVSSTVGSYLIQNCRAYVHLSKTRSTLGAGLSTAAHRGGDSILRGRNPDGHRRAFMHLALDSQRAVMQLHDMLDDRETESRAAQLARARAIDAIESLRQPRDICRRNSLSRIDDDQRDARPCAPPAGARSF